jgi:outer membrane protein assembly factor BamB
MKRVTAFAAGVCLLASASYSGEFDTDRPHNWHQWRGPDGNGAAPHANPPVAWSEQANIKWKVAIPGRGTASPIVWHDRIFVLTAVETDRNAERASAVEDHASSKPQPGGGRGSRGGRFQASPPTRYHQFVVLCLDRNTGEPIWQEVAAEQVPHEAGHPTNSFASASPVTDGQYVYTSFGSRGIYCYDMEGRLRWQRDLGDMQTRNGFGEGTSPALHRNTLVITWDHEGPSFIAALDAATGQTRWQVARDEPTTWATPLIVEADGRAQVITNGTNRVRSYDLESGELIWECGGQASNPIPSPVALEDIAFCMTGFRGYAMYAIPLSARGDITDTDKVVWSRDDAAPYVASPVLYDGHLYFTKSRDAILASVDARTGATVLSQSRLPGLDSLYASLVGAADRIYVVGRNGTTVVLKHGPELDVLATNVLEEGIDASPAIVGNQLFLRGEKHLYCIQEDGA